VASRYVQNHALTEAEHPDGHATKFFDVIDEVFLREPATLARLRNDLGSFDEVRRLESELLEPGLTRALVTLNVFEASP